jgi:hypothetical protein
MARGHLQVVSRWIVFTIAGVVGLLATAVVFGPGIRSWQMGRAIARFERHPTQSRADSLVDLLQAHDATDEQGKRALALLLRPNIVTRRAYAAGQPVMIGMERPFKLRFRRFVWSEEKISIRGLPPPQRGGSVNLDQGMSYIDVWGLCTQPGTYPVELRLQCSLGIERASRAMTVLSFLHDGLPWLIPDPAAWQPSRTYECDFTVSSEVVVVEAKDAEKVELVSSPELDRAMRAAFSARYVGVETGFSTPAGERWVRGSSQISYENIPLAIAFSVVLRLPDGREIPQCGLWPIYFSARAGTSGDFKVDPSNFIVETPGRHKAKLVLVPDPNLAYKDPTIKAIWNGTLEFPVSFSIDANQPGR